MSAAGLYSVKDVAKLLKLSEGRVRVLAESRKVGTRVGREIIFQQPDIDAMRDRRAGRPRRN